MPYIPKNKIKQKHTPYIHENNVSHKFYDTTLWLNLRRRYLHEHPFCEKCEKVLATDCHHRIPFLTGVTDDEKWKLFLDEDNLMALCDRCHHDLHRDRSFHY